MHSIGLVYIKLREFDKALKIFKQLQKRFIDTKRKEDVLTLKTRISMAIALQQSGRLAESEKVFLMQKMQQIKVTHQMEKG